MLKLRIDLKIIGTRILPLLALLKAIFQVISLNVSLHNKIIPDDYFLNSSQPFKKGIKMETKVALKRSIVVPHQF